MDLSSLAQISREDCLKTVAFINLLDVAGDYSG